MDVLSNKRFEKYNYKNRYTDVPYFYHTEDKQDIYGIGSNMFKNTAWVAHKVTVFDTLDNLSLKYYGNPTYWWIIAYFNDIQDSFIKLSDYFSIIKIPSMTNITFGLER